MKFAINYSPQAAEMLDEGRIKIDLYKCPEWPDLITAAQKQRPLYIHFPLQAGRDSKLTFDEIEDLLRVSETYFVNTHLAPHSSDFGIPEGTCEVLHVEAITECLMRDVEQLVARFGAEQVIVENTPMPDPHPYYIPVVPVEVIQQVVEETGCGFLLDVAHAVLTCENLGLDIHEYLSALPVDRLREMHITGIGLNLEGRREDHLPMTGADWELAEWVFERIRRGEWAQPQVLAFEYGGLGPIFEWRSEKSVIAEQVPRLYKLAKSV